MQQISPIAAIAGLLIMLIVLAVPVWLLMRWFNKKTAQMEARIASAIPAQATVVAIGSSRVLEGQGNVLVKLRLRVNPPSGDAYETSVVWEVSPANIPQIQEGKQVAVKIDANTPNIVYPRVPWAQYDWVYSDTGVEATS